MLRMGASNELKRTNIPRLAAKRACALCRDEKGQEWKDPSRLLGCLHAVPTPSSAVFRGVSRTADTGCGRAGAGRPPYRWRPAAPPPSRPLRERPLPRAGRATPDPARQHLSLILRPTPIRTPPRPGPSFRTALATPPAHHRVVTLHPPRVSPRPRVPAPRPM